MNRITEDPFVERSKILKKILNFMIETKNIDEDTYLLIAGQAALRENMEITAESMKTLRNSLISKKEFQDLFSEIEVVSTKTSDLCSITKMKIIDKWVNICGHCYERSAIEQYKKERVYSITCPVIGCSTIIKEKGTN